MPTILWWIRRDLRLHDHPALDYALQRGRVIPVFILDEALLKNDAPYRKNFLFSGLRDLDAELRKKGSKLVLRRGEPLVELYRLVQETSADEIVALEDYSPYARIRDERIAKSLPLRLFAGETVFPPYMVVKSDGTPYTVFTPFSKAWKALPFVSPSGLSLPERFPSIPDEILSFPFPEASSPEGFLPGETEAINRMERFLAGTVGQYAESRNRLDQEGTSMLSPYFRFGMLSPRMAVSRVWKLLQEPLLPEEKKGCETWLNELIWREFYISILYHFPHVLKMAFNPALRAIEWRNASNELEAWKAGMTGYPVVDAAMRQLRATGWMHNRARMIVASFLSKDLLINWQEGEHWFMQWLIDGDPASNNGGWQWTAGVGTDAAPYFRIFNPVLQSARFDPHGLYIRKWVPELRNVPEQYIHSPWTMPVSLQSSLGIHIGKDYPVPIVMHHETRTRVLEAYRKSQKTYTS
ncbi:MULTISPECIES: deoxyribodipyrimidine photo-lyase [Anaerolinea]|uniref:cryptochrome/photolyase family protein n=1 Tax=Anaerolinea TaxID=233189 RepID=UPI002608A460|nr:deoxyribodipyrimidine photo-lyase [Anaerolinea thermophila]